MRTVRRRAVVGLLIGFPLGVYLHAGGGVGATGPVDDVTVRLTGAAALYRLPDAGGEGG